MPIPQEPKTVFFSIENRYISLCPGGCERTEQEYRTLMEKAGFQLIRIVPTAPGVSVIEGVPV